MRTTALTGLAGFVVVTITGVTVVPGILAKSEAQFYSATYKPAAIAMPMAHVPVTKPEIIKYKVADKDTLGTIAAKYNTPWQRIYAKNTVMQGPADLKTGEEIVIPAPDEVLADRPIPSILAAIPGTDGNQAPAQTTLAATKSTVQISGSAKGNLYAPGNCTWYVKSKRSDLPNNLGNASTWVIRAKAQGLATGSVPRAGAVGQRGIHVVYVEQVNGDGTVTISEMNYRGLYVITRRTLPGNYFTYIY